MAMTMASGFLALCFTNESKETLSERCVASYTQYFCCHWLMISEGSLVLSLGEASPLLADVDGIDNDLDEKHSEV